MIESPILFNTAMVRAILGGTKTQTRRIVKPQPAGGHGIHPIKPYRTPVGGWNWVLAATGHGTGDPFLCPYGQPGDRLWVRETLHFDDEYGLTWYATDKPKSLGNHSGRDYCIINPPDDWHPPAYGSPVRAIHMPRWAARITLEITGVRVERLQDISEHDAKAEGAEWKGPWMFNALNQHIEQFRLLWTSINGPGSWDQNPWVWVIEFKRLVP